MVLIVLICVPTMLCVKPIWIQLTHKEEAPKVSEEFEHSDNVDAPPSDNFRAVSEKNKDAFNLNDNIVKSLG